ncbi:MAG: hypothetical protein QN173_03500 [Armatimonadota bacterium]|nr:hypothetical protein [Armatimonadota bacterium]MDR7437098.1 hypothetical protein [Armatimonadota bacterium]MDR7472443.1 hypothetical protein [Armatimonadota bacterium]MDR7506652.1 hypothetical protein [Armatimonadota bacterium]MDR7509210.1 hypothetical protein [Armatimonadota bacterium]
MSEVLLDLTIATQTVLHLAVRPEAAQSRLPAPWQVAPVSGGASRGANLAVIFTDTLLRTDASGQPAPDAVSRSIGLAVPARHPQTGEEAGFNIRTFTAHPRAVPGAYRTARLGSVTREYYAKGTDTSATVTEHVRFRDPGGGSVELQLQYRRGVPVHVVSRGPIRSAADPGIVRVYRVHELVDVVRSVPQNIDRVLSYQLRVTVADLADLFDGTERLVSITVVPWSVRQAYGPGPA